MREAAHSDDFPHFCFGFSETTLVCLSYKTHAFASRFAAVGKFILLCARAHGLTILLRRNLLSLLFLPSTCVAFAPLV